VGRKVVIDITLLCQLRVHGTSEPQSKYLGERYMLSKCMSDENTANRKNPLAERERAI
jgi:hypothetical protein